MVSDQESLEFDLFKDVTLPDMREKEPKKSVKEAKEAKAAEGEEKVKKKKIILTLTSRTEIQSMFEYEKDYELLDKVQMASRPPMYKFVTPEREVVQRLIIRATTEKEF